MRNRLKIGVKSAENPLKTVQQTAVGNQNNFEEKLPNVKKLRKTYSVRRSEIP